MSRYPPPRSSYRGAGGRGLAGVKWQFLSPAATEHVMAQTPWTDEARRRIAYLEHALTSTHVLEEEFGMIDGIDPAEGGEQQAWNSLRGGKLSSLVQPLQPLQRAAHADIGPPMGGDADAANVDLMHAASAPAAPPRTVARRAPPSACVSSSVRGATSTVGAPASGAGAADAHAAADAEVARVQQQAVSDKDEADDSRNSPSPVRPHTHRAARPSHHPSPPPHPTATTPRQAPPRTPCR